LVLLSACGDGGGAGDEPPTDNAGNSARAIEPLAGLWELPNDWRGEANDEAYLLIKNPAEDGSAEAIVYDFDDASTGQGRNCYLIDGLPGSVTQAISVSQELFLNDISAFPDAVVSLSAAGELLITYSVSGAGTAARQQETITATSIGTAENAVEPLC